MLTLLSNDSATKGGAYPKRGVTSIASVFHVYHQASSSMTNYGADKEVALRDIRKVATAVDQPMAMFNHEGVGYATPAGKLIKVNVNELDQFQVIQPNEQNP